MEILISSIALRVNPLFKAGEEILRRATHLRLRVEPPCLSCDGDNEVNVRFLSTLACHVTKARMAAEVPRCFYSTVGSHAGTALVLSHCECAT